MGFFHLLPLAQPNVPVGRLVPVESAQLAIFPLSVSEFRFMFHIFGMLTCELCSWTDPQEQAAGNCTERRPWNFSSSVLLYQEEAGKTCLTTCISQTMLGISHKRVAIRRGMLTFVC